jgi:hypothetical protein
VVERDCIRVNLAFAVSADGAMAVEQPAASLEVSVTTGWKRAMPGVCSSGSAAGAACAATM